MKNARLHQVAVEAAEDAVIAGIPQALLDNLERANTKFQAEGGCKGCSSQRIGVHYADCSTVDDMW